MLEKSTIVQVLRAAQKVGCELVVNVAAPCGGATCVATSEQIAGSIVGELHLPSSLVGLTPGEYADWVGLNGHVQCCSSTASGRQCRNWATGLPITDAKQWKAFRDTHPYCHVHGG
ncbi:hypothetical protein [Xanthomonas theicola]|uniref:hypothetical protein n=1 Tax=Xanthomonas theicola TaxID=56464 RepID=UPI000FF88853|nr:hypothetical protein [Xanthomonas theicola]QNH24816.1 DUF1343 domain-containing protein [Xanthomonas theicola]